MLKTFRASRSNVVVWIILVLLMIGLAGFGISTGASGGRAVASVGDTRVEADAYARALDQELRALTQQVGRPLPMSEARQYGVDRMVLARLLGDAALDEEARRLGVSAGDEAVHALVLATPAFRGADGRFDRQAYDFALERAGLTPAAFEDLLRAETARETIAASLQSAARMPPAAARILLDYAGETRRVAWLPLDASLLPEPTAAPDEAALEAFHTENADRYTRPETLRITYALLEPETLAATIEPTEDELRAAYAAASARYDMPERRILDRIGFGTEEEAAAARARIDAGETDFDALAAERGLTEATMDQGAVRRETLAPEAAEAVFGAAGPGVVGPVPSALGPSLYRINAILAANHTPFEAAREELRRERALALARDQVHEEARAIDDLLAGGATLEEVAAETPFELGEIGLDATTAGGLADDPAFRELAETADEGVETDLTELASGGLVALRVDAVEPPALIPLAEIRDRVAADWTAAQDADRLAGIARGWAAEIDGGLPIADLAARLGRTVVEAGPIARGDAMPDAPAGMAEAIFAAPAGGAVVLADETGAALAQVTGIIPFDREDPASAELADQVAGQLDVQVADDLLALAVQALQAEAGIEVNQTLVDQVVARFP